MSTLEETSAPVKEFRLEDETPAVSRPRSLRKNFSWALVGNIIFAGCQWAMLMVLTKLCSLEMVGQFVLGLAITGPIMMFAGLSLRPVEATDAKREFRFGEYLGLTFVTALMAMLAIGGIVLLGGYSPEAGLVILFIGLRKALMNLSNVYYGLFQQHERMDLVTIGTMLCSLLSLVALGMGVYLTGGVLWGVVAAAAASGVVLATYNCFYGMMILRARARVGVWDNPQPRDPDGSPVLAATVKRLSKLAWVALPLGCASLLISLDTNVPRYFIANYIGERELGIFGALAYVIIAGRMGVTALTQAALPRLSRYHASTDTVAFSRLMRRLLLISVALGAGAIVVVLCAGRELLTLLYRPEYAEHTDIFLWLILTMGLAFLSCSLDCGISAARQFRAKLIIHCAALATTAIASVVMIPIYGLLGAALAMFVSRFVQLALKVFVLSRIIGRMQPLPA